MKNLISILFVMMIVGCRLMVDIHPPKAKTAKEITKEDVVGTYEWNQGFTLAREEYIFKKDKVFERIYFGNDGERMRGSEEAGTWNVINDEVVANEKRNDGGCIFMFFRIEENGDLTLVAIAREPVGGSNKDSKGKVEREDLKTEDFRTIKKIK